MKKIFYLSCIAMIASSCAVGTYNPMARNNFGAQTTVVLDKANFRVVRDVEAIVEVNNTNLKRQDVEKSAYGELLRNARLTGSQVLINVVVEEIRRENTDIFRALFRIPPQRKQYVAARATVIEFLKDNGEPIQSVNCPTESPIISQHEHEYEQKQEKTATASYEETRTEKVEVINEIDMPTEKAESEYAEKVLKRGHQVVTHYKGAGKHFKAFKLLLSMTEKSPTKDNVDHLQAACLLFFDFGKGEKDSTILDRELMGASSDEEKINILIKHCK